MAYLLLALSPANQSPYKGVAAMFGAVIAGVVLALIALVVGIGRADVAIIFYLAFPAAALVSLGVTALARREAAQGLPATSKARSQ